MQKKLWLIRHPEVENAEMQKFYGYYDVELSSQGLVQAEQLADFLQQKNLSRIISTGLKRTDYTAQMVMRQANIPYEVEPLLKEMHFGRWEGLSAEEVKNNEPEQYAACVDADMNFRFPEGESIREFLERVKQGLEKIITNADDTVTAVITHSGVVRMALIDLLDLDFQANWRFQIDYGSLTVLDMYNGFTRILKTNDTCHLSQQGLI